VFFGGVLVVNSWWVAGGLWGKRGLFSGAEKYATFRKFIFGVCSRRLRVILSTA
jgi:hypothetical protein